MTNNSQFEQEGAEVSSAHSAALDAVTIPEGERIFCHMVHLNHLDLTWFWRLPDTIEMCLETIRWHVELLERHPDARYTHTQVLTLKVVEEIAPALFERFARLVKEGRIEVDSGQWVEPDHNMPSGESLARQFLYGQQFIESRFGLRATTLVNSDSFGHTRSLPQIMRQAGIRHMIHKRPRQKWVDLPETPYEWVGIDGTRIPTLRFINKGAGLPSLSQYYQLREGTTELQEKIDRNLAIGVHHFFGSHCISDAGGAAPYVKPCAGKQYSLDYDTPTRFFEAVLAEGRELPVVNRPLNYVYQGCYTTHIEEKEHCRRAERELREVETLWAMASLLGHGYPHEAIAETWRRACFLQFHDILPGTGTHEAVVDDAAHYHELFLRTRVLRRKAQLLLDRCCSTGDDIRALLVANPRPRASGGIATADVEMPINRYGRGPEHVPLTGELIDDAGIRTPYQIVDQRHYGRYVRGTMIFPCPDVPPMGLKTLHMVDGCSIAPCGRPDGHEALHYASARDSLIENEHLRVEVGGPGVIRSIVTKGDGREWLAGGDSPVRIELWPETDYIGDYGSDMKAWTLGITEHREAAGCTSGVTVVENGPVRATARVEHAWRDSRFVTDVSLLAGQDWVEIRTEIDWHEKEVLCRLCVEPAIGQARQEPRPPKEPRSSVEARRAYGIPFGTESATGEELEVPAIGWADISGKDGGMAVLNLDRPGHTFRDNALRVSLVRCATGDWDPCTDSGTIRATLRLLPHSGSVEDARVPERSDEFSHPPIAWQSEAFGGDEWTEPFRVEGTGIVLSTWKAAEQQDGYVLRLHESLGRHSRAALVLGPTLVGCEALESNIVEDSGPRLNIADGRVEVDFRPFEVKTILLKTRAADQEVEGRFTGSLFGA